MERIKLSPCGRWIGLVGSDRKGGGAVNILDANTSQWIAQVHVESRGGLADFQWWHDGEGLSAAGKGGEVVEWDMRERKVVARWNDEGAVGTTVIALGGNSGRADLGGSRWVAIGSSSGIVNIYDRRLWRSSSSSSSSGSGSEVPESPKPAKTFTQLTTAIGHVVFSADGQLMAMASRWKGDALRLSN
jgi:U3 small nucleolar RNA-associated protein 18